MTKAANLKMSKWIIGLLLMCGHWTSAQQNTVLTLERCLEMAEQNYPLIKQYELIEKTKEYGVANAQKGYLPQLNVAGQATYQSEVTQVPVALPNGDIPTISKDQYRWYGEVSQSITDLFTLKDQKEYIHTGAEIETQETEVALYTLRERINHLYFGILLIEAQIQQTVLLKKDIQVGIETTKVAIANGIALKSAADNLKAELLKVEQRAIELQATRKGYADMLALFIGRPVDENTRLEKPPRQILTNTLSRPELTLFDLRKKSLDVQNRLITAKNLPRISLFIQGGLGRPGLNMLNPDAEAYYIGGLRLGWNVTGFYTARNERNMLALQQQGIDLQKETFLFDTRLRLKQQNAEIIKMLELIETDKSIVALRESVKQTAQQQLAYGTATTNDYFTAVNAEDQARQSLILHEIQLLMYEHQAQTTTGN